MFPTLALVLALVLAVHGSLDHCEKHEICSIEQLKDLTMDIVPKDQQPLRFVNAPVFSDNVFLALYRDADGLQTINDIRIMELASTFIGAYQMPYYEINVNHVPEVLQMFNWTLTEGEIVYIFAPIHSDGKVFKPFHIKKDALVSLLEYLRDVFTAAVGLQNDRQQPVDFYTTSPFERTYLLEGKIPLQGSKWKFLPKYSKIVAKTSSDGEIVGEWVVTNDGPITARETDPALVCTIDQCNGAIFNNVSSIKPDEFDNLVELAEEERVAKNDYAPEGAVTFHEVGFEKFTIPEKIYDIMRHYFLHNQKEHAVEYRQTSGTLTNHWKAASVCVNIPPLGQMIPIISSSIHPLIEKWVGYKVVPTSQYGIRIYPRDQYLRYHVDHAATHVLSVTFNIDQDVDEPWPLEILDKQRNPHQLLMQPGEMIFFEGVSLTHGRPDPLQGRFFANFFIHFKPADPALWQIQ